ncbi:HalOD1 output domain-containing protein [Natronococcus occultus]|uniref:HalOD1 output domain-containing protein n=1 Tax=Natronococcus occultus TaxID=29288 RepID=UPI0006777FB7|nr:HalOD1 output domain-containing protein [Natronococcus occultus]
MAATEDRRTSTAVVQLVARVDEVDPVELVPLYDAIDPETLDSICDPDSGFRSLSFRYAGWLVAVDARENGIEIELAEPASPDGATVDVPDAESSL